MTANDYKCSDTSLWLNSQIANDDEKRLLLTPIDWFVGQVNWSQLLRWWTTSKHTDEWVATLRDKHAMCRWPGREREGDRRCIWSATPLTEHAVRFYFRMRNIVTSWIELCQLGRGQANNSRLVPMLPMPHAYIFWLVPSPSRQAVGLHFVPLSLSKSETPCKFQFISKACCHLQPCITCKRYFAYIRNDHKMLRKIHSQVLCLRSAYARNERSSSMR